MEYDLDRGQKEGEDVFFREFKSALPALEYHPGRDGDFTLGNLNKIELKTTFRTTGNLFIEKFGNKQYQTLGGPWKSDKDNCNIHSEFYKPSGMMYFFNPRLLAEFVQANYATISIKGEVGVTKQNKGWASWGHPIPIHKFKDLWVATWKLGQGDDLAKQRLWYDEILPNVGSMRIEDLDKSV